MSRRFERYDRNRDSYYRYFRRYFMPLYWSFAFAVAGLCLGVASYMAITTYEPDDLPAVILCAVGLVVEIAALLVIRRRGEA